MDPSCTGKDYITVGSYGRRTVNLSRYKLDLFVLGLQGLCGTLILHQVVLRPVNSNLKNLVRKDS